MELIERKIELLALAMMISCFTLYQGCTARNEENSESDLYRAVYTGNLKDIYKVFENPDFTLENYPQKDRLVKCAFFRYGEMERGKSMSDEEIQSYREKTEEIVKLLMAKGLDVNLLSDGTPPLYYAIYYRYDDLAEIMIARGAEVNSFSSNGKPLLYLASDNSKWLSILLEKGANINIQNSEGNTPLHLAVANRDEIDVIKLLLENGADPTIKNNEGETPIMIDEKRDQNNHKVQARLQLMRSYETVREN